MSNKPCLVNKTKKEFGKTIKNFLFNFLLLTAKVALTSTMILVAVNVMFNRTEGNASVVVELNEMPINWSVDLNYERVNEHVIPITGIMANVNDSITLWPGQDCMLVGSEYHAMESNVEMDIDFSGTFVVEGQEYRNASIIVKGDYANLVASDESFYYFVKYQPAINISSISDGVVPTRFEFEAKLIGDSVYQNINVDFDSYYFKLCSGGNYYDEYHMNKLLTDDIVLRASKGFHMSFEDCKAYLVDENGDNLVITECEYYFDTRKDVMLIGTIGTATESMYTFQIPRKNDFSVVASGFQDMSSYGVGELSVSNTAKEHVYPLNNQKVSLYFEPFNNEYDNTYTFEHEYIESTDDEENLFRLNASVEKASISGESVIPNFWSWFREVVYNDPLSIVIVILGQIALFGFVGKRKDSETVVEQ